MHNIEELMKNKLSLDDEFEFGCKVCGNCCHNNNTLILTGYDVYNISKHLYIEPEQVISKYTYGYIGDDSKLPIISVKQRMADKSCPFLRKGKCELHPVAKPLTCKLYPLGRMYHSQNKEFIYFNQKVSCGTKEKHTVREWLENVDIEEIDRVGEQWGKVLIDLAEYQRGIKDKERLKLSTQMILIALYLNYNTEMGYLEQLEGNLNNLEQLLPKFKRKHSRSGI